MIIYLPSITKWFRNLRRRIWEWDARCSIESDIARETCEKICKQPREVREEVYRKMMDDFVVTRPNKKMAYCFALHKEHMIPKPRVWGR